MRNLLVYSGTDVGFKNFEAVPPLGIVSIYSALPEEMKRETYFLDGNLSSLDYIRSWIARERPEVVGIGALTFGYQNALQIAKFAKEHGATTVLGGRHATDVLDNILREMQLGNRPFDFVVSGEGEETFRNFLEYRGSGRDVLEIPNLFSAKSSRRLPVIGEQRSGFDTRFPVLDYSLLRGESAPELYMQLLERVGILRDVKLSMPLVSQRGCAYMGEKTHCKFCSIPAVNPKIPYENTQKSLENLLQVTGADHVWITDGDFTASKNHLNQMKSVINKAKSETGKDFVIYCFARSDDLLRPGRIGLLYDLGVRAVFIGYEHGNNEVLRAMHKNTTREQNLEATRKLADRGIEVSCGGIVLGTPSETRQTLDDAVSFAKDLSEIGNVRSIFASPLYPFPGSPYWNEFIEAVSKVDEARARNIRRADILNEEELVQELHRVRHLMPNGARKEVSPSFDEILRVKEEIAGILGKGIQFTDSF